MRAKDETLWDYDVVTPGQAGTPTEVAITADNRRDYTVAMPTMRLCSAGTSWVTNDIG